MYTFLFSLQSNFTFTHNSEMMYCYPCLVGERTKTAQPARGKVELAQILIFYCNGHHFHNQKFKQVILLLNKILQLRWL